MQTRRVLNASGALYFQRQLAEAEALRLNAPFPTRWQFFVVDLVVDNTIIGYLVVHRADIGA